MFGGDDDDVKVNVSSQRPGHPTCPRVCPILCAGGAEQQRDRDEAGSGGRRQMNFTFETFKLQPTSPISGGPQRGLFLKKISRAAFVPAHVMNNGWRLNTRPKPRRLPPRSKEFRAAMAMPVSGELHLVHDLSFMDYYRPANNRIQRGLVERVDAKTATRRSSFPLPTGGSARASTCGSPSRWRDPRPS